MLIEILVSVALIIASYTDIRTREVPDWLNFALIFSGVGYRAIASAVSWEWGYLVDGAAGFAVCLVVALVMYYTGQWGGGDSKMILGLGILLGFDMTLDSLILSFLLNLVFIGAIYGLLWSVILAFKNSKEFRRSWAVQQKCMEKAKAAILIIGTAVMASLLLVHDSQLRVILVLCYMLLAASPYLWVFVRSVEKSCMLKRMSPGKLTEGDWIAEDVIVDGRRICGPKDLGVDRKQIAELISLEKKNRIRRVHVKEGIPFVPSFLLSFLVSIALGNLVYLVI
ncbi:MAG: A24 family peptidase [archaeon]